MSFRTPASPPQCSRWTLGWCSRCSEAHRHQCIKTPGSRRKQTHHQMRQSLYRWWSSREGHCFSKKCLEWSEIRKRSRIQAWQDKKWDAQGATERQTKHSLIRRSAYPLGRSGATIYWRTSERGISKDNLSMIKTFVSKTMNFLFNPVSRKAAKARRKVSICVYLCQPRSSIWRYRGSFAADKKRYLPNR